MQNTSVTNTKKLQYSSFPVRVPSPVTPHPPNPLPVKNSFNASTIP